MRASFAAWRVSFSRDATWTHIDRALCLPSHAPCLPDADRDRPGVCCVVALGSHAGRERFARASSNAWGAGGTEKPRPDRSDPGPGLVLGLPATGGSARGAWRSSRRASPSAQRGGGAGVPARKKKAGAQGAGRLCSCLIEEKSPSQQERDHNHHTARATAHKRCLTLPEERR